MDNNDVENTAQSECEDYPSACFLLDSCFQAVSYTHLTLPTT